MIFDMTLLSVNVLVTFSDNILLFVTVYVHRGLFAVHTTYNIIKLTADLSVATINVYTYGDTNDNLLFLQMTTFCSKYTPEYAWFRKI